MANTMSIFLHMGVHLITGAAILLLLLNKRLSTFKHYIMAGTLGAFISITPDITKFFGDIYLHSLITVPFVGAAFAWVIQKTLHVRWMTAWVSAIAALFIGHLMIDFLGNGVNLLYPFVHEEQNFSILNEMNELIISILFGIAVVSIVIWKKKPPAATIAVMLVILFVTALSISNGTINAILHKRYAAEHPEYITVYPANVPFHWNYYVRIDNLTIIPGKGQYLNISQ